VVTSGYSDLDLWLRLVLWASVSRFDIELQPTSYVVQAGHRIRFTVQASFAEIPVIGAVPAL
jgi:hypothetical protein